MISRGFAVKTITNRALQFGDNRSKGIKVTGGID